ncbi:MAG TPA: PilZ domain-containing protein [Xanthomonadaceae bacterium]|nr:PilZ domain-containing protein [Xanthomonadaceae bacterium]
MNSNDPPGVRDARMPVRTVVLVSRADHAWSSEIVDISASGARISRPDDWEGDLEDIFQLDVVISETAALHVEARVARLTAEHVGFEFTFIPESGQQLFWGLLGRYAETSQSQDG